MKDKDIHYAICVKAAQGDRVDNQVDRLRRLASDFGILSYRDRSTTCVTAMVKDQFYTALNAFERLRKNQC